MKSGKQIFQEALTHIENEIQEALCERDEQFQLLELKLQHANNELQIRDKQVTELGKEVTALRKDYTQLKEKAEKEGAQRTEALGTAAEVNTKFETLERAVEKAEKERDAAIEERDRRVALFEERFNEQEKLTNLAKREVEKLKNQLSVL